MAMIKVMKTVNEYLNDNPNASLADYQEYCNNCINERLDIEANARERYNNWIAEQDGKYFLVEFSAASRVLFKYSHRIDNVAGNDCYSLAFYDGYNESFIKKEKRSMNRLWLDELNPYWPEYKKVFNPFRTNDNMKVVEVSKEDADKLFARYDAVCLSFIKDVKEMI